MTYPNTTYCINHSTYNSISHPCKDCEIDQIGKEEYQIGFDAGEHKGYDDGYCAGQDKAEEKLKNENEKLQGMNEEMAELLNELCEDNYVDLTREVYMKIDVMLEKSGWKEEKE